jgi:SAM-dependent methyltransferase
MSKRSFPATVGAKRLIPGDPDNGGEQGRGARAVACALLRSPARVRARGTSGSAGPSSLSEIRAVLGEGSANPSRVRLDAFARRAGASVPEGGCVLDAGAGEGAYRIHFAHATYEAADFLEVDKVYAPVDYVCSLDAIPVEDERYDLVLCTQVLEHLPEPAEVLKELHRVLRPGGELWLTAPLFYPEHEQPYDFYRYTSFGLRHRLECAGFEVKSFEWLEGYFGTLAFQLRLAAGVLPRRPDAYGGGGAGLASAVAVSASRPLLRALARGLDHMELRHRYTSGGHPKNYAAVAQKSPVLDQVGSRHQR